MGSSKGEKYGNSQSQRNLFIGVIAFCFLVVSPACEYDEVDDDRDYEESVVYRSGDIDGNKRCANVLERNRVKLECEGGETIVKIDYASYGRPKGSCDGEFSNTSCHAKNSKAKVERLCLGKKTCTMRASNTTFGVDPCKGKRKRLAVVYTCRDDTTDECPDDPDKTAAGICGCGTPDDDSDGDGSYNCNDECPEDSNKTEPGECGCGDEEGDCDPEPGFCQGYETRYDGNIILAYDDKDRGINDSDNNNGVRIYPGAYKPTLTDSDIIWEWTVRSAKGKDGRSMSGAFKTDFSGTKNDAKPVWYNDKLHILLASNAGNAVALIRVSDKRVVFYENVGKAVHDAGMMPDGNILAADSQKRRPGENSDYGASTILSTTTGNDKYCYHKNVHGVIYDAEKDVAWFWGGGGMMRSYKVTGTRNSPGLDCDDYEEYKIDVGTGVAHGFAPMLDGSRRLIGTINTHVIWFDTSDNPKNGRWGYIKKNLTGGLKSVSHNPETGEYIYVKNDNSNGLKSRSNTIRSISGRTRTVKGDGAFYKARWFYSNCFALE